MSSNTVKLGDVVRPVSDTYKFEPNQEVIFLNTSDILNGKFLHTDYSKADKLPGQAKKKIQTDDILFSEIRPANKRFAYVDITDTSDYVVSTKLMVLRAKEGFFPKFVYHWITSNEQLKQLQTIAESRSGTFPQITFDTIKHLLINKFDYKTQEDISNFIDAVDKKIELNQKMNETFEQIGLTLFKKYFVDNPDKSNWKKRTLGEFFPIRTGKKDANYSIPDGKYPFFTCSQNTLKAPDYSFEGDALLLAGNGDFNLKYYRGKFEAYQRTYVLIPENNNLVGLLYFLMTYFLSEITGGSRGSVIKFLTKGMIEDYKISLPDDDLLVEQAKVFNQLTINIEKNNEEIETLSSIRNALLPKLFSGEITV